MTPSRKRRGAETQRAVATYMAAHGWPYATDAGAGRNGSDILGVPGLAIEVKARRDLNLTAWLRQASAENGLPIVIHRPDGFGPGAIADWPVTFRLADAVELLRDAGYESEPDQDHRTHRGELAHNCRLCRADQLAAEEPTR